MLFDVIWFGIGLIFITVIDTSTATVLFTGIGFREGDGFFTNCSNSFLVLILSRVNLNSGCLCISLSSRHILTHLLSHSLIKKPCRSEKTSQFQRSSKGHVYLISPHLSNLQINFDNGDRFLTSLIESYVCGDSS